MGLILWLMPMVLLFAMLYFLMIRPEKKRRATLNDKIAAARKGDSVTLNSGIVGTIEKISDNTFVVKSMSSTFEVRKGAIETIQPKEEVNNGL